jgi:tetratricopeptide (TPR) repeat protein
MKKIVLNKKLQRLGLLTFACFILIIMIFLFHYFLVVSHYVMEIIKSGTYKLRILDGLNYILLLLGFSFFIVLLENSISWVKYKLNETVEEGKKRKFIFKLLLSFSRTFMFTLIAFLLIFWSINHNENYFDTTWVAEKIRPKIFKEKHEIPVVLYSKDSSGRITQSFSEDNITLFETELNKLLHNRKENFYAKIYSPKNNQDLNKSLKEKELIEIVLKSQPDSTFGLTIKSDGKWIPNIDTNLTSEFPFVVSFVSSNINPLIYFSLGQFAYRIFAYDEAAAYYNEALRWSYEEIHTKQYYIRDRALSNLYYHFAILYHNWAISPGKKNYRCYQTALDFLRTSKGFDPSNPNLEGLELAIQYESFDRPMLLSNNVHYHIDILCEQYCNYIKFRSNWENYIVNQSSSNFPDEVRLDRDEVGKLIDKIDKNIGSIEKKCDSISCK